MQSTREAAAAQGQDSVILTGPWSAADRTDKLPH